MQMQEHIESPSIKYPTKTDAWIVILIAAILLVAYGFNLLMILILRTVSPATLAGPASVTVVLVFILCLIVPMYYEITATSLVVRSGLLRRAIPLTSIEQVFPTRNPINAPALSLDRLQIDYVADGVQRFILISPRDRIEFLYELARRETGLEIQGDRLSRKR